MLLQTRPMTQDEIYRDQLKKFQAQIDATNAVYNDMLNRARATSGERLAGSLGTERAQQARGGLIGSDFGTARSQTITDVSAKELATRETEVYNLRLQSLAQLYGVARESSEKEYAEKTKARQQGTEALISYYQNEPLRKKANVDKVARRMAQESIDPSKLAPGELQNIANTMGVDPNDIFASYNNMLLEQKKTQAEQVEALAKTAKTQEEANKLKEESAKLRAEVEQLGKPKPLGEIEQRQAEADIAYKQAQTAGIGAKTAQEQWISISEGTQLYNTATGEVRKNPKTSTAGTKEQKTTTTALRILDGFSKLGD